MRRLFVPVAAVALLAACGTEPGDPNVPASSSTPAPPPTIAYDAGLERADETLAAARRSLEPTVGPQQWQVRNGVGRGLCPGVDGAMFYSDIHSTAHEITSEDLGVMTAALADLGYTLPAEADVVPGTLTKQVFTDAENYRLSVMSGDGRGTRMSVETPCLAREATGTETAFSQEN